LYFKSTKIFLKLQLFDNNKESPSNLQVYISILKSVTFYIKIYENQFIEYTVFQDNYDFEANTWNARARRQFDSQSAVKQAVPLAKRSPLPILRIINSKLEIIS